MYDLLVLNKFFRFKFKKKKKKILQVYRLMAEELKEARF